MYIDTHTGTQYMHVCIYATTSTIFVVFATTGYWMKHLFDLNWRDVVLAAMLPFFSQHYDFVCSYLKFKASKKYYL